MQVSYPIVSKCMKMQLKKDGKWIFEDKEAFEEWKEDISISSRLAICTSKARTCASIYSEVTFRIRCPPYYIHESFVRLCASLKRFLNSLSHFCKIAFTTLVEYIVRTFNHRGVR